MRHLIRGTEIDIVSLLCHNLRLLLISDLWDVPINRFRLMWQEVWLLTTEIDVKGLPTSNTAYCHYLVKMDIGPIFLYYSCLLGPYDSIKTNINQKWTFEIYFSICQSLGLDRTLLSELPHMPSLEEKTPHSCDVVLFLKHMLKFYYFF